MITLINYHYNYAKKENKYAWGLVIKKAGNAGVPRRISRRVVRPLRAGCIFKYHFVLTSQMYEMKMILARKNDIYMNFSLHG